VTEGERQSPEIPHSIWVTKVEFARIMGKSNTWADKGIHSGLFFEAGIPILRTSRPSGRGKCQWYFFIDSSLF